MHLEKPRIKSLFEIKLNLIVNLIALVWICKNYSWIELKTYESWVDIQLAVGFSKNTLSFK